MNLANILEVVFVHFNFSAFICSTIRNHDTDMFNYSPKTAEGSKLAAFIIDNLINNLMSF